MDSPLISVIVPNYNHASYLAQRIDSILAQSFDDFELIILDDHSTDDSRAVIEKYRSEKKVAAVLYNEENSGSPFRQWKKGVGLARGKYIWMAESDDWADPDFLATLVTPLETNPEIVLAAGQIISVDASGKFLKTGHLWTQDIDRELWGFQKNRTHGGNKLAKEYFLYKSVISNISSCIFRKSAFDKIQDQEIFEFRAIGDVLVLFELALQGDFFFSKGTRSYCRFHGKNVGARDLLSSGSLTEHFRGIQKMRQRVPMRREVLAKSFRLYYNILYRNLFNRPRGGRKLKSAIVELIKIGSITPDVFRFLAVRSLKGVVKWLFAKLSTQV